MNRHRSQGTRLSRGVAREVVTYPRSRGISEHGRRQATSARGQASVLVVGGLLGIVIAIVVVGAVARAVGKEAAAQRAADLASVAAARVMHANYERLFESPYIEETPNPNHLEKSEYLALARAAALKVAAANDARKAAVSFPDETTIAPVRVRVVVSDTIRVGEGKARRQAELDVAAEAELAPAASIGFAEGGGYDGPLATRQGERMRPDVALAFDRMEAAARADGIALTINSGFRSDAEQAALWNRHPDPKWVAPPGKSLHRYGTELDLGPPAAYGWLAANAQRFHFVRRYDWEAWHFGYTLNQQSSPAAGDGAAGVARGAVPGFVPERFAPILRKAAQRWNVSAKLLAAQLYAESGFNPFARSSAGALGHRAVHAGDRAGVRAREPLRPGGGDQRASPLHARSAAAVRLGAARAGGIQRRAGARLGLRLRPEHSGDTRLRRPDPRPDVGRGRADRARRSGARSPIGQVTHHCITDIDSMIQPVRTTVSLDPDTRALVERAMRERGLSFKEAVNEGLRAGLGSAAGPTVYTTPRDLGPARIDLTKALGVAAALEDDALARRLMEGR